MVLRAAGWRLPSWLQWPLLTLMAAPSVKAGDQPKTLANAPGQSQVFNGDLTVGDEEIVRGDVVVYSGDVTVEDGGRIQGNVAVYSGDVTVAEGGVVDGDVTAWSGDVAVDGTVNGSISAASGTIELGSEAKVAGDISVMSGQIEQQAGASIGGSLLRGSTLKLPVPPAPPAPDLPWSQGQANHGPTMESSLWGGVGGFLVRLLLALLALGAAIGGAAALAALRPQWVEATTDHLHKQTALSFAVGLLVNVLVSAVAAFMFIIVCFRPPGLLLGVALFALNVAGMAVVGNVIGSRLMAGNRQSLPAHVALGVLLPGALVAFLYLFGGCFTFFAYVLAVVVSSFGLGAIITRYLNLSGPPRPGQPVQPITPAPPSAPSAPTGQDAAPAAPAGASDAPIPDKASAPAAAPTDSASDLAVGSSAAQPTADSKPDTCAQQCASRFDWPRVGY